MINFKISAFSSQNYEGFDYVYFNRKASLAGKIRQRLVESILRFGCIIPIIITKRGNKYVIIDGQHRFLVCLKHKLPFYCVEYSMPDGSEMTDALVYELIQVFNSTSRVWTTKTSLLSAGKFDIDSPKGQFLSLSEKYKSIGSSALGYIFSGIKESIGTLIQRSDFRKREDFSEELLGTINDLTENLLDTLEENGFGRRGKNQINFAIYNLLSSKRATVEEIQLALLSPTIWRMNSESVADCEYTILKNIEHEED